MNHISTVSSGGEHVGASPVRVIGLRIQDPRFSATTENAGFYLEKCHASILHSY